MAICSNCSSETSDEFNFCEHCYHQIKCSYKDCGSPLKPGAPICLKCGRKIGPQEIPHPIANVYEEDVKKTSDTYESHRRLQVDTDAVGYFAPLVINQTPSHSSEVSSKTGGSYVSSPEALMPSLEKPVNTNDAATECETVPTKPNGNGESEERALKLFTKYDGDKLCAKDRDFKGASKKEQQKRLVVLYGWAYNAIFGCAVPPKDHFRIAADKANLCDSNFANYLVGTKKEFYSDFGEDGYQLNSNGEAKAKVILAEMKDDAIAGFKYWEQNSRGGKKHGRINKDEMAKITEWATKKIDIGKIDTRELSDSKSCALFALWAITVHLKVTTSVKPSIAYNFVKEKYTISVNRKAFTDALSRECNKKYFMRTPEGQYYLAKDGENLVEGWRNGQPIKAD